MKRILYILIASIITGSLLLSCEPVEDRENLAAVTLTPETLKFSVKPTTENANIVVLKNEDSTVIPYWEYVDNNGNVIGHSNKNEDKITFPFAGKYTVFYTAFARGGAVQAAPVILDIAQNDESQFGDERWNLLTKGAAGKTWILYMTAPISFSSGPTDYPGWWPNLSDIGWAGLENKVWGEVTFRLNGGFNVSVTQTDGATGSVAQTTKTGTFNFNLTNASTNDRIVFNGGPVMLHPYTESYFSSSFSLGNVQIVKLTETELAYVSYRSGDNQCMIFHLVAK